MQFNYVLDDKEDDEQQHVVRHSKRILQQLCDNKKDRLHCVLALAAREIATLPNLDVKTHKLAKILPRAKLSLKLSEWGYDDLFVRTVLNPNTGAQLQHRDLVNNPDLRKQWTNYMTTELSRLVQGIRDVKRTETILSYQSWRFLSTGANISHTHALTWHTSQTNLRRTAPELPWAAIKLHASLTQMRQWRAFRPSTCFGTWQYPHQELNTYVWTSPTLFGNADKTPGIHAGANQNHPAGNY